MSEQPRRAPASLVVVSGLSGSGKTVALRTLEDMGYYCIDNLPAALLTRFAEQTLLADERRYPRIAVGIDARAPLADLAQLPQSLSALAALNLTPFVVFLDAHDDILIKRFSETRRRHPLTQDGAPLAEAILRERLVLKPLHAIADALLDTSELNIHQLRRKLLEALGLTAAGLSLLFESFAYKKGVPVEADFVFDARALPNPHWEPRLRPLSGKDAAVREYFEARVEVADFIADVSGLLGRWLPRFDPAERSYLTVAIGCTGGRHRSVYIVERLAEGFRDRHRGEVLSFHRELT